MKSADPTPRQVLDLPLPDNDSGADTVRGYLVALLAAVWDEGEGFSGKRPFGNSGWHGDFDQAFIKAGLVPGQLDEDGWVDEVILRYEVPVDDRDHWLDLPGPIMHVASRRPDVVEIWGSTIGRPATRRFRVYGTGHEIPVNAAYVATAIVPGRGPRLAFGGDAIVNAQHRARLLDSTGRDHITPNRGPDHWLHRRIRRWRIWPALLPIGIGVGAGLLLAYRLGWWM